MAHYTRHKVGPDIDVDAIVFMPHEEAPELSYEEMRKREIAKMESS